MSAAEAAAAAPLHLVSKNVGGLSSLPAKRHELFSQLWRKHSLDIVLLQETHCADDATARRWASAAARAGTPWRGQALWSHGTAASRGVATLVRDCANIADVHVGYADADGRLLRVDFKYAGLDVSVLNVYAPCVAAERAAFFRGPFAAAMPEHGVCFVGGDFNCVTRADDNWGSADAATRRFVGRDQLERVMLLEELDDAWLLPRPAGKRPHGRQHTFHCTAPGGTFSAARLDRWLTPASLRGWVADTAIHAVRSDYLPGDHAAVTLEVRPPSQPPRGPGAWSLPLHLLNDEAFVGLLTAHIAAFRQQHAALEVRALWDAVKQEVQTVAARYCLEQGRARRAVEAALRRAALAAAAACQRDPQNAVAHAYLRAAETDLGRLRQAAALAERQAADILWQDYGETSSYWFHRLGRKARVPEQMVGVQMADGAVASLASDDVRQRDAAAEAIAAHFDALFTPPVTDAAAEAEVLADATERLSAEAAAAAEGPGGLPAITRMCWEEALKAAPRGKRPGSDGLPYEFYVAFGPVVQELAIAAANAAFADEAAATPLPASQRHGLIVLLHKAGKPRQRVDSYRPITLLNCDYKLVARILTTRLGSPVNDVLSVTQTAFVPGRDIADNVLFHLEEVDWLEAALEMPGRASAGEPRGADGAAAGTQAAADPLAAAASPAAVAASAVDAAAAAAPDAADLPAIATCGRGAAAPAEATAAQEERSGCVLFLDFEKAYDRASRPWLMRCLQHYGFGPGVLRWVHVLLAGTTAAAMFNGWRTRHFAIASGMAQGSPLSPLLYNLQAQPLASHLLQMQRRGAIRPILLPDGSPAPPTHQHADDTTVHLHSVADVPAALGAVQRFCDASGARLNVEKTQAITLGTHPAVVEGDARVAGISFLQPGQHLRHLGILLARPADQKDAAAAMHLRRLAALRAAVRHWSAFQLSYLGRLHVAKQCLASLAYYHAQFVRPGADQLQEMVSLIGRYVARPSGEADDLRAHATHPSLAAASLPREEGGVGMVDVRTQLDALQAKVVARMLHPHRHPWKVLMRAAVAAAAPPHLGIAWPFFTAAALPRDGARPLRLRRRLGTRRLHYLGAMRRTAPHRRLAPGDMSAHAALLEPVLHNACIRLGQHEGPLTEASAPAALARRLRELGVLRLRDLRRAWAAAPGDADLTPLVAALPDSWRAAVTQPLPTAAAFCSEDGALVSSSADPAASGAAVEAVLPDGRLARTDQVGGPTAARLAQPWHPCCLAVVPRPAALLTLEERREIQEQRRLQVPEEQIVIGLERYLVGRWDTLDFTPDTWAHGVHRPLTRYVVKATALRSRRLRAATALPGYSLRGGIFPKAWAGGASGGLDVVEARWMAAIVARVGPGSLHHRGASGRTTHVAAGPASPAAHGGTNPVDPPGQGSGASPAAASPPPEAGGAGPIAVTADGAGPSDATVALAAWHRRQCAAGWQLAPALRVTSPGAVPASRVRHRGEGGSGDADGDIDEMVGSGGGGRSREDGADAEDRRLRRRGASGALPAVAAARAALPSCAGTGAPHYRSAFGRGADVVADLASPAARVVPCTLDPPGLSNGVPRAAASPPRETSGAGPVAVTADGAGPSDAEVALAARHRRQFAAGWQPSQWVLATSPVAAPHSRVRRRGGDGSSTTDDDSDAVDSAGGGRSQADGADAGGRRLRRRAAGGAAPAAAAARAALPSPEPDHHDLANAPPAGVGDAASRAAWNRLGSRELPRDSRVTAWRALHACLYSGVFAAYVFRRPVAEARCAAEGCHAHAFETLPHMFLQCPCVSEAADWLLSLWEAIAGAGQRPPRTAAVLVADDQRAWAPEGGAAMRGLWTALRVSWLHAVWLLRTRRAADPARAAFTSRSVVAATVAAVVRLIRMDYARCLADPRQQTAAPSDWFRGARDPTLVVEEFVQRWGANGVLCVVEPPAQSAASGRLVIRLSCRHPVLAPGEEPAGGHSPLA
jgi:exonuclease III